MRVAKNNKARAGTGVVANMHSDVYETIEVTEGVGKKLRIVDVNRIIFDVYRTIMCCPFFGDYRAVVEYTLENNGHVVVRERRIKFLQNITQSRRVSGSVRVVRETKQKRNVGRF